MKTTSLIYSFANEIREEYTTTTTAKTPFETFLETNNLMQKGKPKKDPIVTKVVNSFIGRSTGGIEKYGTTLEENNTDDFLQHLQEELMDAILYIEKLKSLRL
jgi:hypothetical protein